MTKIFVRTPSRIAMSLLDMNGALGRMDGGPGFSLSEPYLEFTAENSEEISIDTNGLFSTDLEEITFSNLKKLKKKRKYGGIKINITKSIPEHSGFGSKTATLLSLEKTYGQLYNEELSYMELAVMSRRGGTSGIGINIIDKGGFIVDGGHSTAHKKYFMPSSSAEVIVLPPLLARYNMPEWDILVAIPKLEKTFGEKEKRFFNEVCPISHRDVEKLCRIILIQLMPSVIEKNIAVFCQGVNNIQELAWKKSEIELYGNDVKTIMEYGKNKGALCAGMSSIGTAIYFLGGNLMNVKTELARIGNFDETNLFITKPNNKGIEQRIEK